MRLRTIDQPSHILHDGEILGYADPIDGQYVLRVTVTLELPIIANSTSTQSKKSTKPMTFNFGIHVWDIWDTEA